MELLLFWIFGAIAVGMFASNYRNRSGFGFFLLSLLLSPLLGILFAVATSKLPEPQKKGKGPMIVEAWQRPIRSKPKCLALPPNALASVNMACNGSWL